MENSVKIQTVASEIRGTGMCVPERVVSNEHFAAYLETSDEWIRERTGIEQRRWCEKGTSASALAEPACREAISAAGLTVNDIDGIVLGTVTPDNIFPSTACYLQARLGITNGFAFDVNAVCSGFIYALTTADALIRSGQGTNVLVVGVDLYSGIIDPNDRGTCVLFGDGAGAVVLSRKQGESLVDGAFGDHLAQGDVRSISGIYGSELKADGRFADLLCVPMGTANPPTPDSLKRGDHFLQMQGREVFKFAVRSLADVTKSVLDRAGVSVEEVDLFISHQANKRILLSMAKHLGIPEEKVPINVDRYGNTSAATIPIVLAECEREGRIKKGDLLLLSAVGGGFSWGAVLVRW